MEQIDSRIMGLILSQFIGKSVLESICEKTAKQIMSHTRVNCPKCGEDREIFTTDEELPKVKNCKTGRCNTCGGDFYYHKGSCWYETFTREEYEEMSALLDKVNNMEKTDETS